MSFTSTPIIALLSAPVQPLLLPASISLHSETEAWCDLYQPDPLPPTPAVIRLPAYARWLKFHIDRVAMPSDYKPTEREIIAVYDLALAMVTTKRWDGRSQKLIIHDIDRIRYRHPSELDITYGLSFIDVRGPLEYKDTPRTAIERRSVEQINAARAFSKPSGISPFAPRRTVIQGAL